MCVTGWAGQVCSQVRWHGRRRRWCGRRCKADVEEREAFRQLLERAGNGLLSAQDFEFLSRRSARHPDVTQEEVDAFDTARHLYPFNAQVQEHNETMLSSLPAKATHS